MWQLTTFAPCSGAEGRFVLCSWLCAVWKYKLDGIEGLHMFSLNLCGQFCRFLGTCPSPPSITDQKVWVFAESCTSGVCNDIDCWNAQRWRKVAIPAIHITTSFHYPTLSTDSTGADSCTLKVTDPALAAILQRRRLLSEPQVEVASSGSSLHKVHLLTLFNISTHMKQFNQNESRERLHTLGRPAGLTAKMEHRPQII